MKKIAETIFVCASCGNEFGKWAGQCSACGEWNSLKEAPRNKFQETSRYQIRNSKLQKTEIKNLASLGKGSGMVKENNNNNIFSTDIKELDRVLGKGLVRGQVVLFAGEPGIGKSTLLTQLIGKIPGLYVAGEESAEQIGLRVNRLKLNPENFDILETNSIEEIEETLSRTNNLLKLAVVDSIQVILSNSTGSGAPGGVNQIRESTFRLVQLAKRTGVTIFIVGHVTKEGDIAGPKLLEHMVDTVLYFEGDKNSDLRILRVTKNRFGPTDEVGVFKMEEGGLREIKSEEINLLGPASAEASAGKAITVVMEGTRPMMVEIQALVTESFAPMPTRVFSGIDNNRGRLLVAVTQKVLGVPLYKYDVYLSVTGGVKIEDTGADLAVVAAMWSSYKSPPTPSLTRGGEQKAEKEPVYVGEVSLLGEVKKVRQMERREKEAKSMGREMRTINSIRELAKRN